MWETLQGVLQCGTSNEAARSHYNKSSVEFQNEADDADAKACAPRREVISPQPAKTVSVQIQLDVRRPDKINYPEIPPMMLLGLDIYEDKWSANKGALRWEGLDQLGSLVGVLSECACHRNEDITQRGVTNNSARGKASSTEYNRMGLFFALSED